MSEVVLQTNCRQLSPVAQCPVTSLYKGTTEQKHKSEFV